MKNKFIPRFIDLQPVITRREMKNKSWVTILFICLFLFTILNCSTIDQLVITKTPIATQSPTITSQPTPFTQTMLTQRPTESPTITSQPTPFTQTMLTQQPTESPTLKQSPTITFTPTCNTLIYIIETGDTLAGIAAKFGVSIQNILDWNNGLSDSNIRVGEVIVIPICLSHQENTATPK